MKALLLIVMVMIIAVFAFGFQSFSKNLKEPGERGIEMIEKENNFRTATFSGGCFWCVEADFEKVEGVVEVLSGYSDC